MTPSEKQTFYEQGWVVLRDIVPLPLVKAANRMLYGGLSKVWQNSLTSDSKEDLDPDQLNTHVESAKAAKRAGTDPTILDLVASDSDLIQSINEALGSPMMAPRGAQLATLFPHESGNYINEAGYPANETPFYGWHGHLDGLWNGGAPVHQRTDRPMNEKELTNWNRDPGRNGVSRTFENKDANILSFTALLGIPLSDQMLEGSGNLGLLSGAHHHFNRFFRFQRSQGGPLGPDGPEWERLDTDAPNRAGLRHYPEMVRDQFKQDAAYTSDGRMWPKPDLVKVKPGDAVLVLHAVPHCATRNDSLIPRLMAYFRLVSSQRSGPNSRITPDTLCDCWLEWEGMRELIESH